MAKILAIDYGLKRIGIAITDSSNIFAAGLDTVSTNDIYKYLETLFKKENVDCIVIGDPKNLQNKDTDATKPANTFAKNIKKKFPHLQIERIDERFTSKMAFTAMIDGGMKKKDRRDKKMVDKISATIILQSYLEQLSSKLKRGL